MIVHFAVMCFSFLFLFFFQAEDGIRDHCVTGVETCALPILWANVWFVIWPNQKKVLGMVTVSPEEKAAAAKAAGMASRINTMLSIPMLYFMVAQSHGGVAF